MSNMGFDFLDEVHDELARLGVGPAIHAQTDEVRPGRVLLIRGGEAFSETPSAVVGKLKKVVPLNDLSRLVHVVWGRLVGTKVDLRYYHPRPAKKKRPPPSRPAAMFVPKFLGRRKKSARDAD